MNAYARMPVCFVRGEGVRLWDDEGTEYLDAMGGIAVTFLGHCHPRISEAISLQANKLMHVSNLFHIEEQNKLGAKFCQISGMDKVFVGNSGTEANEAAIKITRLMAHKKGIKQPLIICAHHSFHGRTMGSLSATGNPGLQKNYDPLLPGFAHVDFNDVEALAAYTDNPDVIAVMLEPIQGEGGVLVPDEGYLKAVRELCDKQGWLLILDEIQTGMGRTGKWFAFQHDGIQPDILTSAKALGNGVPIGVCAARGKAADAISPGAHGTTFGGSPFASQIALTVIDVIEQEALLDKAAQTGAFLKKQLQQKLGTHPSVTAIRGKGLMLGVQLKDAVPDLGTRLLDKGLVVSITAGGTVIRILPSVYMTENQAKQVAEIVQDVINDL
ncbi:MAG: aspartate aminotransferase family protein [Gammaproteobacteria bacterium]|nr:aspartate aminotransferase family protein [Gammaproteobacteria bacterium]